MIKFPTANGIATMTTKRETLQEYRRMEEARGPSREGRITFSRIQACDSEETTNKGREESPGQTDKVEEPDGTIQLSRIPSKKDTQTDEKGRSKRHDQNSLLRCRTRAQDIPSHRAESAKETEHNSEQKKDDMVIKSKTEPEMIKDVEETLLTLKKVNMKLNPKKCSFRMEEGKFLGYIVTSEGIRANLKKAKAVTTEAEEAFQAMKKLIAKLPTLTAPEKEEELMVYLSAANKAVSAILLVEREGRQAPIHYVSRTLQGAKINYPPMEKLALALVHAGRR
ncbi:reverse transcriptase domain-containing protein [Tanacetum coccineum]